MYDTTHQHSDFPALKEYGHFLLSQCLEEAAEDYLIKLGKVDLPLLKEFDQLKEEELKNLSKRVLHEFFTHLGKGEAVKKTKENILKWKAGNHPLISKENIQLTDISLLYHARKQLLLDFIPRYTNDATKILSIAKEMEELYTQLEHLSFQSIVEKQKEEHSTFTRELQQKNEQLKEQVLIRTKTEEVLEKERNYFQAILENLSDGIAACDENGVLSFFNQATREFHGIPEKAIPPDEWASHYQLFHADGTTPLRKEEVPLFRAFSGEHVNDVEIIIAPGNGNIRLLLTKGQAIKSSQGKHLGALVVMKDITELKHLQQQQKETIFELNQKNQGLAKTLEKLKKTEEQLASANNELEARVEARTNELLSSELQMRLITDALPVLISYIDREERYRFTNKAYEDWFNRPRKEVYGKKLEEVLGSAAYEKVKPTVKRALKGETIYLEAPLDYNEAGEKYVSVHYIPHAAEDKIEGYFALITDISEHKKQQEKLLQIEVDLRKRNEELERINNDLDNFIYTASHDLKSPIVNLQGLTTIIRKKLEAQAFFSHMELLDMVDKSVLKLKNTINELTEIAKVQKDLEQDAKEVSFREIAEDVKEDIKSMLTESNVALTEEWLVESFIYPKNNLRSIFYNLLSNAVKYRSPDRPATINVKTYLENDFVVLKVSDNGLGISQQQQPKLFSMFKRFHAHIEGTGVGLYIIKRIVENRGGKIVVESEENSGSVFKVYLSR